MTTKKHGLQGLKELALSRVVIWLAVAFNFSVKLAESYQMFTICKWFTRHTWSAGHWKISNKRNQEHKLKKQTIFVKLQSLLWNA